jgi:hypothetical protein
MPGRCCGRGRCRVRGELAYQSVPTGKRPIKWLRDEALAAIKLALSREPSRKETVQGLMGEGPKKSSEDNDLLVFNHDPEFRNAAGLPVGSVITVPPAQ